MKGQNSPFEPMHYGMTLFPYYNFVLPSYLEGKSHVTCKEWIEISTLLFKKNN